MSNDIALAPGPGTPISYKGVPVMTTERLAAALGATPKQLGDNHAYHRERFVDGDHVFKVTGADLRSLKTDPEFSGLLGGPRVNALMLWTERGKPYAVWSDTGKKHGDGTPVRQLKWSADIVQELLRGLASGAPQ